MATEPLYNPNDGLTGRDGGPYLDKVQAVEAEKRRAEVEGREPDLENPGAYAGIPLYTAAQMMDTVTVNNTPSQEGRAHIDSRRNFDAAVKDEENLLTVVDERPNPEEMERLRKEAAEHNERIARGEDVTTDVTGSPAPVADESQDTSGNTGGDKADEVDTFNL